MLELGASLWRNKEEVMSAAVDACGKPNSLCEYSSIPENISFKPFYLILNINLHIYREFSSHITL